MFETPRYRLVDHHELQIAECGFVLFMSLELGLKILADGLFFTPKALFKDAAGILDIFTLSVSAPRYISFIQVLLNSFIWLDCRWVWPCFAGCPGTFLKTRAPNCFSYCAACGPCGYSSWCRTCAKSSASFVADLKKFCSYPSCLSYWCSSSPVMAFNFTVADWLAVMTRKSKRAISAWVCSFARSSSPKWKFAPEKMKPSPPC